MSKKLKFGIVGCGGIFNAAHIWEYQGNPDIEPVAFCDIKIERAYEAAEKFGVSKDMCFENYEEMLDKVDEIARKYGLELAGESAGVQAYENEIFFDSLGIDQLHRKDTDASVRYSAGYFYACGNFDM
ncbi:MAG: Gfo/Idh/MocA family oxidoreductase, partial [Acutalibacteraceae bacterium]